MNDPFVYLNGEILPLSRARISPMDRGFLYGDGLFETVRTFGGRAYRLREHLDRLSRSGERIRLDARLDEEDVARMLADLRRRNRLDEMYVRITVTRGPHQGSLSLDSTERTVFVFVRPLHALPNETYARGVPVRVTPMTSGIGHRPLPVKGIGYMTNLVALDEARSQGAHEVLFTTGRDDLVEGAVSNVFFARDGVLATPPLAEGVLPGVTRQVVIALAGRAGIPVEERSINLDDVPTCSGCFLTNSLVGVLPVSHVGEVTVPVETCDVTATMRRLYEDDTRKTAS